MPVTQTELRQMANETARVCGIGEISDRKIFDWIDEGLIERGKATGAHQSVPVWIYSDAMLEVVRAIVALKSMNVHRVSHLRICLLVFFHISDFDGVKNSLLSEFARMRKRQARQYSSNYDYRYRQNLTPTEQAKYASKLPPLDSDLAAAGLGLPRELLIHVISWINWGSDNETIIPASVHNYLLAFGISTENLRELVANFDVGGALGKPNEIANSGQHILKSITEADLELARLIIWMGYFGLIAGEMFFELIKSEKLRVAFHKARNAWLSPEWLTMNLALFVIVAFRYRTNGERNTR